MALTILWILEPGLC